MGTETETLNGTLNGTGLGWAPVGRHVRRLANPLICWLIFDLIIEFANKLAQNSQREERQSETRAREREGRRAPCKNGNRALSLFSFLEQIHRKCKLISLSVLRSENNKQ